MRLIGRITSSFKIRYSPSCFFYDQEARCAVPGLQLMFIKSIETPGGYPAKIHGGRSQPADGNSFTDQAVENIQGAIGLVQVSIGEACYQAGGKNRSFFADLYLLVIQRGAESFLCKKEFIDKGVVYCSQYDLPVLLNTDGYATERDAVGKIHRSVDGIDDPFKTGVHDDLPGFFAQKEMIRVIRFNNVKDCFFRSVVCFCD